jgi:hypothetical protein
MMRKTKKVTQTVERKRNRSRKGKGRKRGLEE